MSCRETGEAIPKGGLLDFRGEAVGLSPVVCWSRRGPGAGIKQEGGSKCGVVGEGKEGGRRLVQKRVHMVCLQPIGREFAKEKVENVGERGCLSQGGRRQELDQGLEWPIGSGHLICLPRER